MHNLSVISIILLVAVFYLGMPQRIYKLVLYIIDELRFKMIFHYVEYQFHGERLNTWEYGPLNDLAGTGLVDQIKSRGGKIIFHQTGKKDFVLDVMRQRKSSGHS